MVVEEARQIAVASSVHKIRSQRLLKDLGTGGDALVTDKDVGRALYEATDLALLFSAKGAADGVAVLVKLSCMLPAILGVLRGEIARGNDTVDQAVVEGLGGGQVVVALGIGLDLLDGLARGIGQDLVELAAGLLDLLGHNLNLGLLTLGTAAGW